MADSNINDIMGHVAANPWNGLRTYVEGEVLYGRSEEIRVLSLLVMQNSQTVVYGKSGIGKSSVLNAGIFPLVRRHGIFPVYVRFEHNVDISYLDQIKAAVDREIEKSEGGITPKRLVQPGAEETLWEYFYGMEYTDREGRVVKPLVVFDQFEEIFTLEKDRVKRQKFFNELAGLINNVMPEHLYARGEEGDDFLFDVTFGYKQTADFHVVFTLREDFLSYFERHTADIPALKHTRYSLRPINEMQAAEIITRPRRGLVSEEVAKLIIEKVTREKDFELNGVAQIQVDSAILSLYLSRLYEKMVAEGETTITSELVETHSDNIIEDFYSDSIRGLRPESVEWLENTLLNEDGRRDNRDRWTVVRESGLSEEELDRLIYDVKLLRQFSYGGNLRVEYIHDVLCPVIAERRKKREEEARIRVIEDKARREKRKSVRRLLSVISVLLFLALAGGAYWWWYSYRYVWMVNEYYADFRLENGFPVGVGEKLTEDQRKSMPLYYRLSKKGHDTKENTEVEICSSNSLLPRNERLRWPEFSYNELDQRGKAFNGILSTVKTIRFETGEDSKIARMVLFDEEDSPLLVMSYFHTGASDAWVHFLKPNGQAFTIRDNEIDRMKVSWDDNHRVSSQQYYSSSGTLLPLDTTDNVTGFLWRYPDEHTTLTYYLNTYGQPSDDKEYNQLTEKHNGNIIEISYAKADTVGQPNPVPVNGRNGYARIVREGNREKMFLAGEDRVAAQSEETKDRNGNVLSKKTTGKLAAGLAPLIEFKYKGDTGLEVEKKFLTLDGKPFGKPSEIYFWETEYSDNNELVGEKRRSADQTLRYSYRLTTRDEGPNHIRREEWFDLDSPELVNLAIADTIVDGGKRSSRAFYGTNSLPINMKVAFGTDSVSCHLVKKETEGNTEISRYYSYDPQTGVHPLATNYDTETMRSTSFCRKETRDGDVVTAMEISDADGRIVKKMIYFVRDGQVIGRAASSVIDGSPVRCPNWEEESFGYYVIYYSRDFSDQFTAVQAYDEWLNPSLIYFDDQFGYQKVKLYDFYGQKVPGLNSEIMRHYHQPKFLDEDEVSGVRVPFVHILSPSSVLHASRIKDGDRLLSLGAWRLGMPETLLSREWNRLAKDGDTVEIVVLRKGGNGMERKNFQVRGNSAEGERSEYHVFNLSNREATMFNRYAGSQI